MGMASSNETKERNWLLMRAIATGQLDQWVASQNAIQKSQCLLTSRYFQHGLQTSPTWKNPINITQIPSKSPLVGEI